MISWQGRTRFSRGQVQVLYSYLPGALFAHDLYEFCRVSDLDLDTQIQVNGQVVLEAVTDTLRLWPQDLRIGFPDPRDDHLDPGEFLMGTPKEVKFVPYPQMLQCQRCQAVYHINELLDKTPGRCPRAQCGGAMVQFRFVQAHNCGRLEEVYLPKDGCPIHGRDGFYFDDTGRVPTARWRCRQCGGKEIARLRQTPCMCAFTQVTRSAGTRPDEGKMRFYAVSDPAVFRARVTSFVNFQDDVLEPLTHPDAQLLIPARMWGLLMRPVADELEEHTRAADFKSSDTERAMRRLAELAPNDPLVQEWRSRQVSAGVSPADKILILLGIESADEVTISRRMREHVAILDSLRATTVARTAEHLAARGDHHGVARIREAFGYAKRELGILELRALEDFPIGLCAIGYTRVSGSPAESALVAFPAAGGRTPLPTIVTDTEALYCQADPVRVVGWLHDNGFANGETPADAETAWGWLYRRAPGLRGRPDEPHYSGSIAVAVRSLIHTMSHVLLRHIEWSGYAPQSLGEYIIPEGLAWVIYANRHTETKIGGLLTLFEQRLHEWLESSLQQGRDCKFDPFCYEDGGSCAGCLHREYNCPTFNMELSRALLYGGPTSLHTHGSAPLLHSITKGYWEWA